MNHEANRFITDIEKINKTELSLVWLIPGNLHSFFYKPGCKNNKAVHKHPYHKKPNNNKNGKAI